MFDKSYRFQSLLISVYIIFLFGCSPANISPLPVSTASPEQMDKSPFTGIPCAIPCWQGLEVGASSEHDVISLLPTLTFINQDSIQMFRTSMPGINNVYAPGINMTAACVNINENCLVLEVVDDVLTKIILKLNYDVNMGEAVGYLGEPDYIGIAPLGTEHFACEIHMIWSTKRFFGATRFDAKNDPESVDEYCKGVYQTGQVPFDLPMQEVRYVSEAELEALMSIESSNTYFEFSESTLSK